MSPGQSSAIEERVSQVLSTTIDLYGPSLLRDPQRLKARLEAACPGAGHEIGAVLAAAAAQVPHAMMAADASDDASLGLPSLVERVMKQSSIDRPKARFAVRAWARAMAVSARGLDDEAIAGRPRTAVDHHASVAEVLGFRGPGAADGPSLPSADGSRTGVSGDRARAPLAVPMPREVAVPASSERLVASHDTRFVAGPSDHAAAGHREPVGDADTVLELERPEIAPPQQAEPVARREAVAPPRADEAVTSAAPVAAVEAPLPATEASPVGGPQPVAAEPAPTVHPTRSADAAMATDLGESPHPTPIEAADAGSPAMAVDHATTSAATDGEAAVVPHHESDPEIVGGIAVAFERGVPEPPTSVAAATAFAAESDARAPSNRAGTEPTDAAAASVSVPSPGVSAPAAPTPQGGADEKRGRAGTGDRPPRALGRTVAIVVAALVVVIIAALIWRARHRSVDLTAPIQPSAAAQGPTATPAAPVAEAPVAAAAATAPTSPEPSTPTSAVVPDPRAGTPSLTEPGPPPDAVRGEGGPSTPVATHAETRTPLPASIAPPAAPLSGSTDASVASPPVARLAPAASTKAAKSAERPATKRVAANEERASIARPTACTRVNCGSVVASRPAPGDTRSFEMTIRMDDRSIHTLVQPLPLRPGTRVRMANNRFVPLGGS